MNKNKILLVIASLVLLVPFLLIITEKTGVTNIYTKPTSQTSTEPRPINDVNYTPATSTDNEETNENKQSGAIDSPVAAPAQTDPINITLSAANQDVNGGPVVVRALINNASSGTCTVKIANGGTAKNYTTAITKQGTYYNCAADIPYADVTPGAWALTVTAVQGSRTGTVEQQVLVKAP